MYLFIFTGFWHPAGKNPALTATELSETIGTSERNTDRKNDQISNFFFIWFLLASSWHGHTHTDTHTLSNTRQEKAREEEEGVKLEHNTWGEIPTDPLHFIQVFLFSQALLTGIIPLQNSTEDKKSWMRAALPWFQHALCVYLKVTLPSFCQEVLCVRVCVWESVYKFPTSGTWVTVFISLFTNLNKSFTILCCVHKACQVRSPKLHK